MALPLPFSVHFVLLALFTITLPCVNSQGLTLDSCVTNRDCVSPRTCGTSNRCIPPIPITCLSDDVCPEGEGCFFFSGLTRSAICASTEAAGLLSGQEVTQPNPTGGKLTGESCFRNEECRSPRICVIPRSTGISMCVGRFLCFCAPPVFQDCEKDEDCEQGETCGFLNNLPVCSVDQSSRGRATPVPQPTAVVDPDFVNDSVTNQRDPNSNSVPGDDGTAAGESTSSSEVCVAERHLTGVAGIYERGRLARVLCDSWGSCATRGHLVVFHGKGMMMRSYCEAVGCTESVMKVNSPKWQRQLRVESWSHGLEFTAFAARYETAAEEIVLAGVVRAGL